MLGGMMAPVKVIAIAAMAVLVPLGIVAIIGVVTSIGNALGL